MFSTCCSNGAHSSSLVAWELVSSDGFVGMSLLGLHSLTFYLGDASASFELSLPRTEARRHRRFRRLHPQGVEDAAELAQDLGPQRECHPQSRSHGLGSTLQSFPLYLGSSRTLVIVVPQVLPLHSKQCHAWYNIYLLPDSRWCARLGSLCP